MPPTPQIFPTNYYKRRCTKAKITKAEQSGINEHLQENPKSGEEIRGGLRKLRWGVAGRGKRGGARVIYYIVTEPDVIILLNIYKKSEKSDLTAKEIKAMSQSAKALAKEIKQTLTS